MAPVRPRMHAFGLQCLELQIAVAFPNPQKRAFPGTEFSRKTWSPKIRAKKQGGAKNKWGHGNACLVKAAFVFVLNSKLERCCDSLPWYPLVLVQNGECKRRAGKIES